MLSKLRLVEGFYFFVFNKYSKFIFQHEVWRELFPFLLNAMSSPWTRTCAA